MWGISIVLVPRPHPTTWSFLGLTVRLGNSIPLPSYRRTLHGISHWEVATEDLKSSGSVCECVVNGISVMAATEMYPMNHRIISTRASFPLVGLWVSKTTLPSHVQSPPSHVMF